MGKRRITVRGFLKLLSDLGDEFFVSSRKQVYYQFHNPIRHNLDEYFPFSVEETGKKLVRRGWVEIRETEKGKQVILTEKGRTQVLKYDLDSLQVNKKNWDGQWRMIFFDVSELQRKKRDTLRRYLKQLGLFQMQASVWISPWGVVDQVKYLREVLDIPDEVKWGIMKEVENSEDLKKIFKL